MCQEAKEPYFFHYKEYTFELCTFGYKIDYLSLNKSFWCRKSGYYKNVFGTHIKKWEKVFKEKIAEINKDKKREGEKEMIKREGGERSAK